MLFRELNQASCKTYLVACNATGQAVLIDPVKEHIERYIAMLAYHRLTLTLSIDTHTHADHRSGAATLRDLLDARVVMHKRAPSPRVDLHVDEGDKLAVGELELRVLYTPGHTPDAISLVVEDRVFTGDTLLIGGTGRTDFAGGDPAAQYESITRKLFVLPDETLIYPAHDYRGRTSSTIGKEKQSNPRLAGKTRDQYIGLMNHLGLPLPDKIQTVLQPNQCGLEENAIPFPTIEQLSQVRELSVAELACRLAEPNPPVLIDVREDQEVRSGEMGHIPGSRLIALRELPARRQELEGLKDRVIVTICRAGVRSAIAAAILRSFGFEQVFNLAGGMVEWDTSGVARDL
jgi:glyoxylase-like metal-dependent hydrolase (beta-lactamase superfamily II)/rhodanese-related sulfurtransferase